MRFGCSKALGMLVCATLLFRSAAQSPEDVSLPSQIARVHRQIKTRPLGEPRPPVRVRPENAPSTATLSITPNPALFGQIVTITATISPGTATGRVSFYDGVNMLASEPVVANPAVITTGLLAEGPNAIYARFAGNSSNIVVAQVVTPPGAGLTAGPIAPAGAAPYSVAVGDFNEDGVPDLATANAGDGTVSVLAGNGAGAFAFQPGFTTGSLNPYALVVGDFNGDGHTDVAVANSAGHTVSILLGNGDGTLQAPIIFGAGSQPFALAAADFNGDGILDLAVIDIDYQTTGIFLGVGDGTMIYAASFGTGTDPWAICTGDFNDDGIVDLAVADSGANVIQVMLGQGNGSFRAARSLPRAAAFRCDRGDWNNDGKSDLAVAYSGFSTYKPGAAWKCSWETATDLSTAGAGHRGH